MFAFISGIVEEKGNNIVVINSNGVGFELNVSDTTIYELPDVGNSAKVYTYMAVREDAITLFGFASMEEKATFLKLINVSGIGGKVAITMLSAMPVSALIDAILTENIKLLSSIKGLGKKTAERVVLELRNSFDDMQISLLKPSTTMVNSSAIEETIDTLVAMGLTRNDATQIVKNIAKPDMKSEELIKLALKNMNK
ncbi:MAG: Holliday junction branch migration protein RuvA [Clostridiales bacterium]|nr:Holliday junction branch migration protein RuvA [Clostridiales bacterium]